MIESNMMTMKEAEFFSSAAAYESGYKTGKITGAAMATITSAAVLAGGVAAGAVGAVVVAPAIVGVVAAGGVGYLVGGEVGGYCGSVRGKKAGAHNHTKEILKPKAKQVSAEELYDIVKKAAEDEGAEVGGITGGIAGFLVALSGAVAAKAGAVGVFISKIGEGVGLIQATSVPELAKVSAGTIAAFTGANKFSDWLESNASASHKSEHESEVVGDHSEYAG